MKNKWKTSAFWIAITSVVVVGLNVISGIFNLNVDVMSIVSVCSCVIGLLITVGVLSRDNVKQDGDITENVKDEILDKIEKLESDKQISNRKQQEKDEDTSKKE